MSAGYFDLVRRMGWWSAGAAQPADLTDTLDDRCGPFWQVNSDHRVEGPTRIYWAMRPAFRAPRPWTFQVQVGESGVPNASDWQDVGAPVVNGYTATDGLRRALGKQLTTHYRVRVVDGAGVTHYSAPSSPLGNMGFREWGIAREIIRKERLRLKNFAGSDGYLLKRRRSGDRCPECTDPLTGSIVRSKCLRCDGTGYDQGYYAAVPLYMADLGNEQLKEGRNPAGAPAPMTLERAVQARVVAAPLLSTGDVWVNATSDERWWVDTVVETASVRNLPLVYEVRMYLFAFDSVVYKVPLGGL